MILGETSSGCEVPECTIWLFKRLCRKSWGLRKDRQHVAPAWLRAQERSGPHLIAHHIAAKARTGAEFPASFPLAK